MGLLVARKIFTFVNSADPILSPSIGDFHTLKFRSFCGSRVDDEYNHGPFYISAIHLSAAPARSSRTIFEGVRAEPGGKPVNYKTLRTFSSLAFCLGPFLGLGFLCRLYKTLSLLLLQIGPASGTKEVTALISSRYCLY